VNKHPARFLLAALLLAALPIVSQAFVAVSISVAPPVLPVYEQPPIPAPGYLWTPGYWAWDGQDYYWVPGTWVLAPDPGLLWTPGYWGWVNGTYLWHEGYWGPRVGFYGGVDYGYGYTGTGFVGGEWRGGTFFYNRAAANLGAVHITNVYERTVVNNITVNRVSFNGGSGGTHARPTAAELAVEHERHVSATPVQNQHEQLARNNPELRASVNHGHPAVAATARPTEFSGHGVVASRDAGPALRTDRPPSAPQHVAAASPHASGSARIERPEERPAERTPAEHAPAEHAPAALHESSREVPHSAPHETAHSAPHEPQHAQPAREERPQGKPHEESREH
jgi:WXXGXW repeat (2 copies)